MNPNTKMINTIIYRMLNEELKNKATVVKPSEEENTEKIDKIEKYLLNKRKDIHFSHLKNDIKYEIFKIIQDILIIIEGGS